MKKLSIFVAVLLVFTMSRAQERDNRLVGIVAFGANSFHDSLAAKSVYSTVSRLMVQTKRFTVLEVDKWKKTQEEIDRQKGAAFIEQDIVQNGKSLGARILVIGSVKNAELYQDAGLYSARVDYELKFTDVATGKSIAAAGFTGNSETVMNVGVKLGKGMQKLLPSASSLLGSGNSKKARVLSTGLSALSAGDKKSMESKLVDAIESTAAEVNTWIRKTFNFDLLFLKVLEEDKRKGAQYVLIEGGDDVGMEKGYKLKMVSVTEIQTSTSKIRDEEPIAELEVEEVRAQTSRCKVVSGGKNINGNMADKNVKVVFN